MDKSLATVTVAQISHTMRGKKSPNKAAIARYTLTDLGEGTFTAVGRLNM